jgi:hypothetical protein
MQIMVLGVHSAFQIAFSFINLPQLPLLLLFIQHLLPIDKVQGCAVFVLPGVPGT